MTKTKNLVGLKFGRLTIIEQADDYISPQNIHSPQWKCKCSCGNEVILNGRSLTRKKNSTKSCGCIMKERAAESLYKKLKQNTYDLTGDYGIGYTTNGEKFYFDLEDYNNIKDICWCFNGKGYLTGRRNNKSIVFYRKILNYYGKNHVDHINHQKFDNRKENLRIVTPQQNHMNSGLQKNNTSGITGVYRDKKTNKWIACIKNKEKIMLGSYEAFEDAVNARKEAEEKYFGEFSYDNSLKYKNKQKEN